MAIISGLFVKLLGRLLRARYANPLVLPVQPYAMILGGGTALRVLADGENGTALWLAAGGFHALVPGGVPPGEFGETPAGLSLLVLSQDDLINMGPAVWVSVFQPQAVLFTGGSPPLPGWIALDGYDWVSFQSDGTRYWVEGSKK